LLLTFALTIPQSSGAWTLFGQHKQVKTCLDRVHADLRRPEVVNPEYTIGLVRVHFSQIDISDVLLVQRKRRKPSKNQPHRVVVAGFIDIEGRVSSVGKFTPLPSVRGPYKPPVKRDIYSMSEIALISPDMQDWSRFTGIKLTNRLQRGRVPFYCSYLGEDSPNPNRVFAFPMGRTLIMVSATWALDMDYDNLSSADNWVARIHRRIDQVTR
jgi:hypothetical protein